MRSLGEIAVECARAGLPDKAIKILHRAIDEALQIQFDPSKTEAMVDIALACARTGTGIDDKARLSLFAPWMSWKERTKRRLAQALQDAFDIFG